MESVTVIRPRYSSPTIPEKVLLVASALAQSGEFTAEALVVAAWQSDPIAFGLAGYGYPDSNRVLATIMGRRGLVSQGWLIRMGPKRYMLSQAGREAAAMVAGDKKPKRPIADRITEGQESWILDAIDSRAAAKFRDGLKHELTFADACDFWGEDGPGLAKEIAAADSRIRRCSSAMNGELGTRSGRVILRQEITDLGSLSLYLRTRFERHVKLLTSRANGH